MTTFEHAMLGTTGALAVGLHHRGWQIVGLAGMAAVLPDWDGLSLLFGPTVFDQVHRTAGHSLITATLVAVVFAAVEYRLRLLRRCACFLGRRVEGLPVDPHSDDEDLAREGLLIWSLTAVAASASHLAADLLFSGHASLSDWGLKLFWPLSDRVFVYPAVHWGDPVPTILLVAGMFAMLRWRTRLQRLATLTLAALVGYIALRATVLPY